ncbi:response regulator [candidate division WWE3 bacterium CG06_land_8_20_14_3_00_42_16]|uniref:Response regulator n=2 Tax=Katanobacteria TaxID=422282 RepID=A0A2M7ANH6_UNCKA|nr:MAG: response regulator [candidate division WWE3 bacterium CG06_land_8_20_14_3_00_42_16]PJC68748.1 MAG: response regulator [candidate division WWE3 bacterium CG_4_8_14_3_um_filter_42_11]
MRFSSGERKNRHNGIMGRNDIKPKKGENVDTTKTKILIIEDDFYIHDLYKRQLEKEGFEVRVAEDGQKGFSLFQDFKPKVVLLDLMLPAQSGFDVLRSIKENEDTKSTVVLLLTNVTQDESIKEGFKLGADGYLVKSAYTPAQVVSEVKTFLV